MTRGADATDSERIVPSEMGRTRMRACMSCSLVKSMGQFVAFGCENCPFMDYQGDRERVSACTTTAFVGLYVLIKPKESWVAKWQRVVTLVPGAYAISIDAKLPDDVYEQLLENDLRTYKVLATAAKPDLD